MKKYQLTEDVALYRKYWMNEIHKEMVKKVETCGTYLNEPRRRPRGTRQNVELCSSTL